MHTLSDTHCIQLILNGNTEAYSVLVNRYKDMVFSLVLKIVRTREEAEEVTQDAFVKAYQSLGNFKNEARFSTWVFRIAYNTAISNIRKKRNEFLSIEERTIENYTTDNIHQRNDTYEKEDQLRLLQRALAQLPEDERALITLFYQQAQSVESISQITGLTESNVKVKLHRIRKKMHEMMDGMMKMAYI